MIRPSPAPGGVVRLPKHWRPRGRLLRAGPCRVQVSGRSGMRRGPCLKAVQAHAFRIKLTENQRISGDPPGTRNGAIFATGFLATVDWRMRSRESWQADSCQSGLVVPVVTPFGEARWPRKRVGTKVNVRQELSGFAHLLPLSLKGLDR